MAMILWIQASLWLKKVHYFQDNFDLSILWIVFNHEIFYQNQNNDSSYDVKKKENLFSIANFHWAVRIDLSSIYG